jgi:hypothetical protein
MRAANWFTLRRKNPMLTLKFFAPLLVFLGMVGIGLLLKRILPAGTTIHLPKYMVVGLIVGGVILLALVIILIVVLVLNR